MTILLNPACHSCSCVATLQTFIGGEFTTVGGTSRLGIAKLAGDGTLNTVWSADIADAGGNASIKAMILDGSTLYVGGQFDTIGGVARECLAALDATTGAVQAWSADISNGANDNVDCLLMVGTDLYVGGTFTTLGGSARVNGGVVSTAGVVGTWNANANGAILCMKDDAGIIYFGGSFTTVAGGTGRNRLAAIDTAGVLQSWNPNAGSTVRGMVIDSGIVYVVGAFSTMDGSSRKAAAAIDTAGVLQSWDPSLRGIGGVNAGNGRCLAIDGTTIYIGGGFLASNATTRNQACAVDTSGNLLAWNPNFAPDTNAGTNNGVYGLFVQDDNVYMTGLCASVGGITRNDAAVVGTDGVLASWDANLAGGSPTGESIIAAE
jgi:hypothetical protein